MFSCELQTVSRCFPINNPTICHDKLCHDRSLDIICLQVTVIAAFNVRSFVENCSEFYIFRSFFSRCRCLSGKLFFKKENCLKNFSCFLEIAFIIQTWKKLCGTESNLISASGYLIKIRVLLQKTVSALSAAPTIVYLSCLLTIIFFFPSRFRSNRKCYKDKNWSFSTLFTHSISFAVPNKYLSIDPQAILVAISFNCHTS